MVRIVADTIAEADELERALEDACYSFTRHGLMFVLRLSQH